MTNKNGQVDVCNISHLTKEDRQSLRETWKYLDADKNNGASFFVRYFKRYPLSKNFFRDLRDVHSEDININLVKQLGIGMNVMNGMSYLMDSLDNTHQLDENIKKIVSVHIKRGLKVHDLKRVYDPLVDVLEDVMADQCSSGMKESWRKLINILTDKFEDETTIK